MLNERKILAFINKWCLPKGYTLYKWHSIKEKPVENSGVYCSFGMGMKPISPAIFKNGKFYSVMNGNEIEYVTWWTYNI